MVANPMQRKTRNSFLLGMIITLLVCLIIGAAFYVLVIRKNEQTGDGDTITYVYRLKSNVESGHEITLANVESIAVTSKVVPSDAFASKTKTTDSKGKETWKDKAFPGGYNAKVDLKAGTILSSALVTERETELNSDLRYVEYNMLTLPTTLIEGEFVDIRLKLPNGQDLIVVSKKEIKTILGSTIGVELSEQEILMMESAIVEAYVMGASKFYVTQYVEPGMQTAATNTYVPTQAVQTLIAADSNIVKTARESLVATFNEDRRSWVDSDRTKYIDEETENIEEKLKDEIENAKAAREAYLSGLTSY